MKAAGRISMAKDAVSKVIDTLTWADHGGRWKSSVAVYISS
eukprot:COSAG02_NODE_3058_length_7451_cov_47.724701_11_plen_40_part_01